MPTATCTNLGCSEAERPDPQHPGEMLPAIEQPYEQPAWTVELLAAWREQGLDVPAGTNVGDPYPYWSGHYCGGLIQTEAHGLITCGAQLVDSTHPDAKAFIPGSHDHAMGAAHKRGAVVVQEWDHDAQQVVARRCNGIHDDPTYATHFAR
jgi:hypothetical protein